MFFFFGIMPRQKALNYNLGGICPRCGRVCNYDVVMHASSFSLFFIPVFTFGKNYFVKTDCCDEIYMLHKELGRSLEKNLPVTLTESDLIPVHGTVTPYNVCPNCNYEVDPDFIHCPKCGSKLK